MVQRLQPRRVGDVGEPRTVFFGRIFADAFDIGVHRKAQGIGVDATVGAVIDRRLKHHVGVRSQPLQHHAVRQVAVVIQCVEQLVVPKRGPALVHHLGLALGVEILRYLAHDAHDLALPGLQQWCIFFDEVEQIFLRLSGKAGQRRVGIFFLFFHRHRAPQIVDLLLGIDLTRLEFSRLLRQRTLAGAAVAVHAVAGERVA